MESIQGIQRQRLRNPAGSGAREAEAARFGRCRWDRAKAGAFLRTVRRVAQTCGSLHVCDGTEAWLTVMRPQREGKDNSQTSWHTYVYATRGIIVGRDNSAKAG
jgi:hypothetical protein